MVQRIQQGDGGPDHARRRRDQREGCGTGEAARWLREETAMTSRREFLGAAAVTATSRVLGASDRIGIGIIGVGGMGFGHVKMLKPRTDVRIVAISDIYTARKQRARDFLGLREKDGEHDCK